MHTLKWEDFLRHHPIFACLDDSDMERLFEHEGAVERACPADSVILREGEVGNSIFLIGSGSVRVVLAGKDGQEVTVTTLRSGEYFGEMGLFQQQPRSATVITREPCILLEIYGESFLELVHKHPDIEFKVLLVLSERLRHSNEYILDMRLQEIDEKLNLFTVQLNTELRVFDSSMKASQTIFDQTRLRADEVINSAERSRSRMSYFLTTVATILGLLGLSGGIGITRIWQLADDIAVQQKQLKTDTESLKTDAQAAHALATQVKHDLGQAQNTLAANRVLLDKVRPGIATNIFLPALMKALDDDPENALDLYNDLRQVYPEGTDISFKVLREIGQQLATQSQIEDYTLLLGKILEEQSALEARCTSYFLLLTNIVLLDKGPARNDKMFQERLKELKQEVEKDRHLKLRKDIVQPLEQRLSAAGGPKQGKFQQIRALIATE